MRLPARLLPSLMPPPVHWLVGTSRESHIFES
jgi:hypothetical protein